MHKWGDPSRACISATAGLVTSAGLWGWRSASAARSGLARHWWISSEFVAPSTRMGSPLTECPGRCRVVERGRAGSPQGQTQPHGAWNACSKEGGNSGSASGADKAFASCRGAFSKNAQRGRWKAVAYALRGRSLAGHQLGAMTRPTRGSALERRVTTATPF